MSSERLRLEVAILAADDAPPKRAPPPHDAGEVVTVLAISADADVRRHVQECLRDRANVRVVAAATVGDGLTLAARAAPRVMVVDAAQSEILMALAHAHVVILVDELPTHDRSADSRVRFLARPFTSGGLLSEVDRLL